MAAGRFGLRGKLLATVALVVLLSASTAAVGSWALRSLDQSLAEIFERRIAVQRDLEGVSDDFAVTIVDTVHKVAAGRVPPAEGARVVREHLALADQHWAAFRAHAEANTLGANDLALHDAATAAGREALALIEAGDLAELERFRTARMYPRIEPHTERLEQLIAARTADNDAFIQRTRARLTSTRAIALGLLVVTCALAVVAGIWMSRRLVSSISAIEATVRRVATGDLTPRIGLAGNDELAQLASDLDAMIAQLERSRRDLETVAREANAANAAKSLFLSSMSHELRTPLNVVLGYAQILRRDDQLGPEQRKSIGRILDAGTHLLGLIDDVLSISRIEAGSVQARLAPCEPRALVAAVVALLAPLAAAKDLALDANVDASVAAWIETDEGKLRQVLVNLVGNAIKFTARGSVHLALRADGDTLHAEIRDTGPGIAPADAARLFQTFFQGEVGRASVEGTGLGLFISRALARLLGGDITFETEVGRGTTFRVHVRAAATEPLARRAAMRAPQLAAGTRVGPMLIVDDRVTNREMLNRTLTMMGFVVDEAADGAEGLAKLQANRYSLAWMDIRMPVMDGADAVARLRGWETDGARPRTPVIAITASVLDLDQARAKEQGFDGVVGKPFSIENIVATIETVIGVRLVETAVALPPAQPGDLRAPSREELATLPAASRAAVRTALVAGDTSAALAALGDSPLERKIRALIESYNFENLLDTLREM